jgi:uncharacterized protein YdeI (YjbR/CyaY-like superfamily)
MELKNGNKTFYAKSRKAWRAWLKKNHLKEQAVWLIIYRKETGIPSVYYSEAVDEALCFGWIDSKPNKRDDESFYQFFSKRNPKSNWSKVNKAKVEQLLQQGLIAPAGLEAIDLAKQNGTWTALDAVSALTIPDDMMALLKNNKKAADNFTAFPPSVKRGILEWILNARRPETRLKRIEETIRLAAENIRANQYVKK